MVISYAEQNMKIAYFIDGFPKLSETFILNQIDDLITRQGNVEIHPHKDTFFIYIHISNGFFTKHDYLRALKT